MKIGYKKRKGWWVVFVVFTIMMASSIALSNTTVRFLRWRVGSAGEKAHEQFIKNFEKEHPTIKIIPEVVDWPDYNPKFMSAVLGGSVDVAYSYDWIHGKYMEMGAFEPLDKYIKIDKVDLNDYTRASIIRYKGDIYELPFRGAPCGLFYNVDYFKEAGIVHPPRTWEEFQDYAVKLTVDKGGYHPGEERFNPGNITHYGYTINAGDVSGMDISWCNIWYSYGGKFLNNDGTAAFNDEAGVDSLNYIVNLYRKYQVAPQGAEAITAMEGVRHFSTGLSAMYIWNPTVIGWIQDAHPSFQWETALLPSHNGYIGSITAFVWLAMSAKSPNKKAAWEFIKYMTGPVVDYTYSSVMGFVPNHIQNLRKPVTDPKYVPFRIMAPLPGVKNIPVRSDVPKLLDFLLEAFQRAITGKVTPKKALDEAAIKWNKSIME